MLDLNVDRLVQAVGLMLVGIVIIIFGANMFGKGSDNIFTKIFRGSDGYAIEYDLNSGSGNFNRVVIDYEDNEYMIPDREPKLDSHTFIGWEDSVEKETHFPGTTLVVESDLILTAQWRASTHDVIYDLNGGRGTISVDKVPYDTSYNVTKETPTKEGMHLLGWENSANGQVYQPGDTVDIVGKTTFKAVWETNEYTVSYDLDGGKNADVFPESKITHDRYYSILMLKPTKQGFYFHGWLNSENDEVYDAGDNFQVKDDVTLTAQWSKNNHRIVYDLHGGAYVGNNHPDLVQYGIFEKNHTISSTKPVRTGYTFNGWDNNRDDKTYKAGSSFVVQGDTTLTANWIPSKYRVTYDVNGGNGSYDAAVIAYGKDYTVVDKEPTRKGYLFNGWVNSQDNQMAQAGSVITVVQNTVLKADWIPDRYDVKFELNGGRGSFDGDVVSYGSDFYIPTKTPEFVGRDFKGWLSSGDNKVYQPEETIVIKGDTTLTAQWDLSDHVIDYDVNGGAGKYESATMTHESDYTIHSEKPTRYGYTFMGWVNSYDDEVYQAGDAFTVLMDVTLKASWDLNEYMVDYNLNGGLGTHTAEQVNHGETYQILSESPKREGYSFVGWRNNKDNRLYNGGARVQITSDVTLTAEWLLDTFNLTYDLDQGSGSDIFNDVYRVDYNKKYTLTNEIPTRTGHKFIGWTHSENGQLYDSGAAVDVKSDVSMKAQWEADDYEISFDLNGGVVDRIVDFQPTMHRHGASFSLSRQVPRLESDPTVRFVGWLDSMSGLPYDAGSQYTVNEDSVLVAQWEHYETTVEYDENGGDIEYQNPDALPGDKHIYQVNSKDGHEILDGPTLKNSRFIGWKSNLDGQMYQPGEIIKPTKDLILKAEFELNEYELTYHLNGGSGQFGKGVLVHGKNYTISNNKPTRRGYTFDGWKRSDNGEVLQSGAVLSRPYSDIELKAQWSINRYRVDYVANDANNVPASINDNYGVTITISDQKPTRDGYTFIGWRNSTNNRVYQAGDTFILTGHTELVAQWSTNRYDIRYNVNGGSGSAPTVSRNFNTQYTIDVNNPTRTGYQFKGWLANDSGGLLQKGASITVKSDVDLVAQWEINRYELTYDVNGGSGSYAGSTHNHGSTVTINNRQPTRSGYDFNGWRNSSDGRLYQSGQSVRMNADVVLTAEWKRNSVSISFELDGGQGSFDTVIADYGSFYYIPAHRPTKDGYQFDGWSVTWSDSYLEPGQRVYLEQDLVLTAQWSKKPFVVSYDLNGGSGDYQNGKVEAGGVYLINNTPPVRDGYIFKGWRRSDIGVLTPGGQVIIVNNDINLIAEWEEDKPVEYQVSFDFDGGNGSISNQSVVAGSYYTIPYTTPYRTGYQFTQWRDKNTGVRYNPGQRVLINQDSPLIAEWDASRYDVRYFLNGGSGSFPTDTVSYGGYHRVSATQPTRTGYTFKGWRRSDTGTMVSGDVRLTVYSGIDLTAEWERISLRMEYDLNGGSGDFSTGVYNYGDTGRVSWTRPTRPGWDFMGWSVSGSSLTLQPGDTYHMSRDIVLTAQWNRNLPKHTVRHVLYGGSGTFPNKEITEGERYVIPNTRPTRSGYRFKGWRYWLQSGGGPLYQPGDSFIVEGDVYLDAEWESSTVEISYNLAYGSGSFNTGTTDIGGGYSVPNTEPTRSNYEFLYWIRSDNRERVLPGSYMDDVNSNVVLTAQWKYSQAYNVTYETNGGSGYFESRSVVDGGTHYVHTSIPTRSSYVFTGWRRLDTREIVQPGEPIIIRSDVRLFAEWSYLGNMRQIAYDPNGGSFGMGNATVQVGRFYMISPIIPTRSGYSFTGWRNTETNEMFQPGQQILMNDNVWLEATWQ